MMATSLRKTHDGFLLNPEDHPNIELRRKRNDSFGADTQQYIQGDDEDVAHSRQGIATPPSTPHRTKKRVRFSDPNPTTTTGLTPFLGRSSLASPPPSKSRRHSTPSARWNLAVDDTPIICGTLQFASIRQALDGKTKRRICRNGISEEFNSIEAENKNKRKAQAAENQLLRAEVNRKDQEIQKLRKELDLASQFDGETDINTLETTYIKERIRNLELVVMELRAELQSRERDAPTYNGPDWALSEGDPFDNHDVDASQPNIDDEFNAEMTDVFHSMPSRRSFPSPPETMPNTPNKSTSPHNGDCEASCSTREQLHFESQLETFRQEIKTLKTKLELNDTTHERLTAKLAPFIPEPSLHEQDGSLDAALDAVLTELALSESATLESSSRISALSNELSDFFSSSQSPNPESIVQELRAQFRTARLELEYLTPGENIEGFENSKLLDMLISRLRVLTAKAQQQDADIDQYHSQEVSVRRQLGSCVDAMAHLQDKLTTATSDVTRLESDIHDRDETISKLTHTLQGYRDEVVGLESLVNRLEVEYAADNAVLRDEIEGTKQDADGKLLDLSLKNETLEAAAEGREILMRELEKRLTGAVASARALEEAFAVLQAENSALRAAAVENEKAHENVLVLHDAEAAELLKENNTQRDTATQREKAHGDALVLRDARVAELGEEIERINDALKRAQDRIAELEKENRDLTGQVWGERERGDFIINSTISHIKGIADGNGYKQNFIAVQGPVSGGQNANSSPAVGAATSQTIVNAGPEPLLSAKFARRRSTSLGMGRKRRRYDSGLGFLDEEDEGPEDDSAMA